jgi:hypothetical protein
MRPKVKHAVVGYVAFSGRGKGAGDRLATSGNRATQIHRGDGSTSAVADIAMTDSASKSGEILRSTSWVDGLKRGRHATSTVHGRIDNVVDERVDRFPVRAWGKKERPKIPHPRAL